MWLHFAIKIKEKICSWGMEELNTVSDVQERITETVHILNNFQALATMSRSEYVNTLLHDASFYYGYSPYLMEKLFHMFSASEARVL